MSLKSKKQILMRYKLFTFLECIVDYHYAYIFVIICPHRAGIAAVTPVKPHPTSPKGRRKRRGFCAGVIA